MGSDGVLYDFHRETRYWIRGQRRILGIDTTSKELQAIVDQALLSGECEKVEFKPFLTIGDEKWNEVTETVIAFANTKGGVIIFGVNKHCSVVGIERGISELARKKSQSLNDAMERYKGEIRRFVGDNLNRGLMLDISEIKYGGHHVVSVIVPEGQYKPYAHVRTNDIFVRRGSNNVRPDPDTELPSLLTLEKGQKR